jgi:hypothetical protein
MRIKIFKNPSEEEEQKWQQMSNQSINERIATMLHLQRMAYPDTFDAVTLKRKPLQHLITIKKKSL